MYSIWVWLILAWDVFIYSKVYKEKKGNSGPQTLSHPSKAVCPKALSPYEHNQGAST